MRSIQLRWPAASILAVTAVLGLSGVVAPSALGGTPATTAAGGSPAAAFYPVTAQPVLDTTEGIGAAKQRVATNGFIDVQVAGQAGVPVAGVSAVALQLAAPNPLKAGEVTVYATGLQPPSVPTLSLDGQAGMTTALVPLGDGGKVRIHNAGRAQNLTVTVTGYWLGTGDLNVLPAAPVLDSRAGVGVPAGKVTKDKPLTVAVNGIGGVPSAGVSAVALQISAMVPAPAGSITVYQAGADRPQAPTLFLDGGTGATTAIVPVGTDGKVTLFNAGADRDITMAVTGFWRAHTELTAITPQTTLDTASGVGAPKGQLDKGKSLDLQVADMGGVPAGDDVRAVALQVTGLQSHRRRSLIVYPTGSARPAYPSLMVSERSASTTVIVPVGQDGKVTIYNDGDKLDLQAAVAGYWTPPAPSAAATLTSLEGCSTALGLTMDASPSVATVGSDVQFGFNVRNDPVGACLDVAGQSALLTGTAHLPGTPAGEQLTDINLWLELPNPNKSVTVLPSAASLKAGALCPGDDLANCTSVNQPTFGQINYPNGPSLPFVTPIPIPPSSGLDVPFRFFPKLSASDKQALAAATDARLAVSVTTTAGNVQTSRTPLKAVPAPAAPATSIDVTLPDASSVSVPVGDIAAGAEVNVDNGAKYTVRPQDPDSITTTAVARSGQSTSPPASASTTVILDPATMNPLLPTADPDLVTSKKPTDVFFAVSPTFVPSGPVNLTDPSGKSLGQLKDDGTNGDIEAGDGSYGATIGVALAQTGEFTVSSDDGSKGVTGHVSVTVAAAGEPVAPAASDTEKTITSPNGAGPVVSNQIVVFTAADATFQQVKAAADAVSGTVSGRVDATTWQIDIPAAATPAALQAVLTTVSGFPGIVAAEPNGVSASFDVTPSDPRYGEQSYLKYIRANEAWAFNRGDTPKVIVAVVDTGIDRNHEDLASQLTAFDWDFVNNDEDAADDNGHGTHVAGIIGAATNNHTGVAGVNWSADLMALKVGDAQGHLTDTAILAGTQAAVDHGAKILNMSFGSTNRSETQARAIDYAWSRDRLVMAAAGNNNSTTRFYPAAFDRTETFDKHMYNTELVAIGAIDNQGKRASFSNHGPWVDMSAPGVCILSAAAAGTTLAASSCPANSPHYLYLNGTSMATPVVSGVASLVWSREKNLTAGQLKARLMNTTLPTPGQDVGAGSVDAFEATFNGSFEDESFVPTSGAGPGVIAELRPGAWDVSGTAHTVESLGPIKPRIGKRMGFVSNGPSSAQTTGALTKTIKVEPATLKNGRLRFTFQYDYVTEEYPEYVGTVFDDDFKATLRVPGTGKTFPIVSESVNASTFSSVSGIDFPGGDSTVGQSGWKTATADIDASQLAGATTLELRVSDRGDAIFDSVVLLDDFQVK